MGRPVRLAVLVRSGLVRQTALFSVTTAVSSAASAVSAAILARHMSTTEYGNFAFAVSFLLFTAMFFDFGLSGAAARTLAQRSADAREVLGAAVAIFVPIGVLYVAVVYALGFVVDGLFNVDAGSAIRITAPFAFAYALLPIGLQLAQGLNRLHVYSFASSSAQIVFLVALAVLVAFDSHFGITLPLALRGAGMVGGAVLLVVWLRPLFRNFVAHRGHLVSEARAYGFQVYLGRLIGTGTYNMDVLMVAAWTNPREVGLYNLAGALTAAVGLPVTGLGLALFPQLVDRPTLALKWLAAAAAGGLVGLVFLWALGGPLIDLFFSSRYHGATEFIVPLAAAVAVRGVTGIYNSFLAAHGRGAELRNAAIVLTAGNLILNFALIPPYGALGAAWASFVALVANLLAHVYYYRRAAGAAPVQTDRPAIQ